MTHENDTTPEALPSEPVVAPPAVAPVAPVAPTNSLAIVAFVLSLFGFVSGIGFIAGIVCGHISLSQIKRTNEGGRALAMTALIIGYVMVGVLLILIALGIIILAILLMNQGFYPPEYGRMHMDWQS